MSEYNFREIEEKWQNSWEQNKIFEAKADSSKPKYYSLDMFPYPSGAGLHVGHPLGYIASDIVSRYKRIKGFNVLHPMGFDSFGLPAEQYAVQTGQHPAITTEVNIKRYKEQLRKVGFSFDWSKEVWTSKPDYYKWTQWIFIQLFHSWYNKESNKAEHIDALIKKFEAEGNTKVKAVCSDDAAPFTSEQWKKFSEAEKQQTLLHYRMTYLAETMVNWCPALGTVLANEEVVNGVSERGGHPVERKKMKQWMMRITAYAERLLKGLDTIDWPDPMKEMQRNWIGKSYGAELNFQVVNQNLILTVFTTRVDTTFGVTYLSIAPEHELIPTLTTADQKANVEAYVSATKNRSERDRMSDVKTVSGQFTGSYAINPFTGKQIPIWIADYVLAGYGTGVVMAVPSSDERDYKFATHYKLPIIAVQEGEGSDITKENFDPKKGTMINSDFLNGLTVPEAIQKAIQFVEEKGFGKGKVNFRIRDAIFSRQRYWGEPIPIYYKDGIPYTMEEKDLPLVLPKIDEYKPTETGEPPLGRAKDFTYQGNPLELNTMPGWAGSSWYFLRYMDSTNEGRFVSKEAEKYWGQVDLYIGGNEHATGHLLYSRFWNKFLFDMGYISNDEPFKKLINQGMIQGMSMKARVINKDKVSYILDKNFGQDFPSELSNHIPVEYVDFENNKYILKKEKLEKLKDKYPVFNNYKLPSYDDINSIWESSFQIPDENLKLTPQPILEKYKDTDYEKQGYIELEVVIEKMSKRWYNVVNPDDIVDKYGADTLRMYEMFLGPLQDFKPWNTHGIEGVHKFLRKLWRLFYKEKTPGKFDKLFGMNEPSAEELKILHKTIKKIEEDIERFSFNTSISTFMICVNELSALNHSISKDVLKDLLIILSPYAPFITEELWATLGNEESISKASFPVYKQEYVAESSHEYPISINGKVRAKLNFALDMPVSDIEKQVLANESVQKWLEGKAPKKVIVVPNKIVNVVI